LQKHQLYKKIPASEREQIKHHKMPPFVFVVFVGRGGCDGVVVATRESRPCWQTSQHKKS